MVVCMCVCFYVCVNVCVCACEYLKPMVTICDYHQLHIVIYIFPFFCNHLELGGGKGYHSGGKGTGGSHLLSRFSEGVKGILSSSVIFVPEMMPAVIEVNKHFSIYVVFSWLLFN